MAVRGPSDMVSQLRVPEGADEMPLLLAPSEVSEDLSEGLQRLCREGSTTLSRWMINGVGEDVTPAPIFEELRR
ncbi:MAG TPA: hypothetical protein IAC05_01900 [Candidatus Coprenecus stercorigallinarum]|nr:hypothetical protein [Candidatus Coprenecus stercorigallinarum]